MNVRKTPRKNAVTAGGGAKRATIDAKRSGAPPLQRAGYRIIVKRDWGVENFKGSKVRSTEQLRLIAGRYAEPPYYSGDSEGQAQKVR
jgi:hypothetical protein